jgi:hypothetical protein
MSNTAHNWLKNVRSHCHEYKIIDHEMVLNLPAVSPPDIVTDIFCSCPDRPLPHGAESYHCFSCQSGRQPDIPIGAQGITFRRHQQVCNSLQNLLDGHTAEGWLASNHKVSAVQPRMDVILTQGDNVILFDVCVSNPAGQTSAVRPLAAAVATKYKKDKFLKVSPLNTNLEHLNASFVPIALETTGAIDLESLAYLETWSSLLDFVQTLGPSMCLTPHSMPE